VHSRAAELAAWLASALAERGLSVLPRGRSTLVSWRVPGEGEDVQAEVERLAAAGIVVRSIPMGGYVRVSVGAWSSEEELERLVGLVARRR
jgi:selenocysteine lyase/cysteine desulfurase